MAKANKTTRPLRISDPATRYARDVVAGKVVAGPHVRAACRRHLHDLETAKERGLVWDVKAVKRVVGFFRDVLTVEVEDRDDEGGRPSR
jgi:phage terminase large subunit-like protein